MLRVGVTGGIGSGKSTVSRRLAELGATVVDADQVARAIVEAGEPALETIRKRFGDSVIQPDGALDRAGLAAIVFPDPDALGALEAITGPAILDRVAEQRAAVPSGRVTVFDMPLLVERRLWVHEHLAVVVHVEVETRVSRLVEQRGLDEADVRHRIAAQVDDEGRRAAADVWLDNNGTPADLVDAVDTLWRDRLDPWNSNLVAGRRARRPEVLRLSEPSPDWPARGARVVARLAAALALEPVTDVSHIGSTSVPGLLAKDVIDVQIGVRQLADADRPGFRAAMSTAGYVVSPDNVGDTPHPAGADATRWAKRFWSGTDPGQHVHIHVRETGGSGWRFALLFRDWLTRERDERTRYAEHKQRLARTHGETGRYAEAKEPWFDEAFTRAHAWAATTGWSPR